MFFNRIFFVLQTPTSASSSNSNSPSSSLLLTTAKQIEEKHLILKHCIQKGGAEVPSNKDVTSLDWNV
uniref:Uncharacterized protein n=1 Tax=Romanomermis culicivorax TaxID=13658 RepID=A0A915KCI1_ROMCU